MLKDSAAHCNILQHTTTQWSTLQYAATHLRKMRARVSHGQRHGKTSVPRHTSWHPASTLLAPLSCSVLQCVAVCCSVLQCVAVRCSVLQCVAVCCSVLQCVAVSCSALQCVAVCCSDIHTHCQRQCVVVCCSVLQCVAV